VRPDRVSVYDEESVKQGDLGMLEGAGFMNMVFRSARQEA